MMTSARVAATATIALLAACGTAPPAPPPPPSVLQTPSGDQPVSANDQTETVTLALLRQAETRVGAGEINEAVELVERAIRIDPRRGDLWLRLGQLNFRQSHFQQAEQFARKGLLFLPSGSIHERSAWLLIADVREALDDNATAHAIREQWQIYRG